MSTPENTAVLIGRLRGASATSELYDLDNEVTAALLAEAADALAALQATHDQSEQLRKRYFDESVQAQNDLERAEAAVQQMRQALEQIADLLGQADYPEPAYEVARAALEGGDAP